MLLLHARRLAARRVLSSGRAHGAHALTPKWAPSHSHAAHDLAHCNPPLVFRVGGGPAATSLAAEFTRAGSLFPEGHPAIDPSARGYVLRGGRERSAAREVRDAWTGPEAALLGPGRGDPFDNDDAGTASASASASAGSEGDSGAAASAAAAAEVSSSAAPDISDGPDGIPLWVRALAQVEDAYLGVVLRRSALEASAVLEAAVERVEAAEAAGDAPGSSGPRGVLLTGAPGRGKSVALAYAVGRARESGWLCLYSRATHDWTHTQGYVPPCPVHEGLYRLPRVERSLLAATRAAHEELLASLPARSDAAVASGDATVLAVFDRAINDIDADDMPQALERSSRSVAAAFAELRLCTDARVLIAVDELGSLYDETEYLVDSGFRREPRHGLRRIHPSELLIIRLVEDAARDMARGVFAGALSSGPLARSHRDSKFRADVDGGYPLERVVVDANPEEAVAIARMWHHQGLLSVIPEDEDIAAIFNECGRNLTRLRDEINRKVAIALDDDIPTIFDFDKPEARRWFGGVRHE